MLIKPRPCISYCYLCIVLLLFFLPHKLIFCLLFSPCFRKLGVGVIFFCRLYPNQTETPLFTMLCARIHPLQIIPSLGNPWSSTVSAARSYVLVTWLLYRFHVTSWARPMIKQCGWTKQPGFKYTRLLKLWGSVRMNRPTPGPRQWGRKGSGPRV